jgi:hypothetical protein
MFEEFQKMSLNDESSRRVSLDDISRSDSEKVVKLGVLWMSNTSRGSLSWGEFCVERRQKRFNSDEELAIDEGFDDGY